MFVEDEVTALVDNVLNRRKNVQSTVFDVGKRIYH